MRARGPVDQRIGRTCDGLETRSELLSLAAHGDEGARRRRWPTSPPSIPTARRPTRSPSSTSIPTRSPTRRSSARWRCRTPATSCTTSAGTPAPRACARTRRTRMSSGATWWCRACAPRASTSSTPSPIPRSPKIVKVIEPEEVADKAGYTRPHTVHCGPDGIYVTALGNPEGKGPGGIFLMDHETFDVRGRWEIDRGPQQLRLRCLVAPRPRHAGHQRVGHARHVRERARSRRCCSAPSTATGCTSGTCTSASTCRPSTSATSISSCSSCAPRTTRPRPTASSTA